MVGIFPFAVLLALLAGGALTWAVLNIFKRSKAGQPIGWKQFLLVLSPLLVIDVLVCFYIMISAGLSHSARLNELVPIKCAIATAATVVLPMLVLVFYRPKNSIKNGRNHGAKKPDN